MTKPRVDVVIPARYQSTRYPGKPLVPLRGVGGVARTLVERTWRTAKDMAGVDGVWIATDDDRIAEAATGFGASVVMTSPDCRNGTERCADALARLPAMPDIVVNLQGDAPLTPHWFVEDLLNTMLREHTAVATPILRCTPQTHARFLEDRRNGLVGGTTAVVNAAGQALYFSKEVLPYMSARNVKDEAFPVFHHVGVYAYTTRALLAYAAADECLLEKAEGLEQLRFLFNGIPIQCVTVDSRGREFWELNNPSDVSRIEAILAAEGLQ